ncbi:hypothetical protein CONLIGDRAFT_686159 [Coniochaeta ligniaria NRRL 30616]|uniref:Uncharacterized protein n=1 Tax=Coniochaeta ligniaria NRRL 30616 TaxID=1408157 RepID=A0A1J7I8H4_9PEZI|nr:hypothetical protein CONLIGDRAFT_686159 [Coniochaeta ligniaria NRRL 30616]
MKFWFMVMLAIAVFAISYLAGAFLLVWKHPALVVFGLAIPSEGLLAQSYHEETEYTYILPFTLSKLNKKRPTHEEQVYPRSSRATQLRMKFWFKVILALTVLAISYLAGAFLLVWKYPAIVGGGLAIIALYAAVILGPVRRVAAAVGAPR